MTKRKQPRGRWVLQDDRLFTLEVALLGGPVSEKFAKKNPVVARTVQIRGDQTLEDLHDAIFDAFDREEEHMYEFQVGGKRPMDPNARKYVLHEEADGDPESAGTVAASIGSLDLKKGNAFGYWFDFGDDWRHQIKVLDVAEKAGPGKYPRVIKRVGESPPQYVDWDDEE